MPKRSEDRTALMRASGYVTVQEAAELAVVSVPTLYRLLRGRGSKKRGDQEPPKTQRVGSAWFVQLASLAQHYASAPTVKARIEAAMRRQGMQLAPHTSTTTP